MNYLNRFMTTEKHLLHRMREYSSRNIIPILDYAVEHNDDQTSVNEFVKKKETAIDEVPHERTLSQIVIRWVELLAF